MWLWERLIGLLGLLRAISAAVLGECFSTSFSPGDSFLICPFPPSPAPPNSLGPSPFPRMTVSFNSTVAPTVRLVSVATRMSGYDLLGETWSGQAGGLGSVCIAVSTVRSALLGYCVGSTVELATSTVSEPKTGGKKTCESPLRELRGVLEDNEEAEELEYEPWQGGAGTPLATVDIQVDIHYMISEQNTLKKLLYSKWYLNMQPQYFTQEALFGSVCPRVPLILLISESRHIF